MKKHRTARSRYWTCYIEAKNRGIAFEITFEEWYQWWLDNGYDRNFPLPNTADGPCMCRIGDVGPYRINNIYLATRKENSRHREDNKPSRKQKVQTPWGIFSSVREAAKILPIPPTTLGGKQNYIRNQCKSNMKNWAYL